MAETARERDDASSERRRRGGVSGEGLGEGRGVVDAKGLVSH